MRKKTSYILLYTIIWIEYVYPLNPPTSAAELLAQLFAKAGKVWPCSWSRDSRDKDE